MRIAHASDTHDRPSIVKAVSDVECDVIVLSGDNLGNKGRVRIPLGWGYDSGIATIHPYLERKYQESWFRKVAKRWAPAFRGRPVVYVPGNHDFIEIERWLKHYGHENIFTISAERPYVDIAGVRFAGFREIPWISGEWMAEVRGGDFTALIDRAFGCNPDILVTHAPPGGILDGPHGYGIPALASALFYREHKIKAHFFGHEHSCGGQTQTENGILFANGACHLKVHEVNV